MSEHLAIAIRALRRRGAAEDGFTILFALVLLVVGIGVGAAALADTLSTRSHANLDQRQRRALQAADFGIQAVLYRVNQLNIDSLDLSAGKSGIGKLPVCVVHKSNGEWATETPTGGGACPKVEQEIGNHDSYMAEFVPNESTAGSSINFVEPKIVAIGIDETANASDPNHRVYARVDAGLSGVEPFKTVEANHDLTYRVPFLEVFNGTARAGHNVIFKGESALTNLFTGLNIELGGKLISAPVIEYACKKEIENGLLGPNVILIPGGMVTKAEKSSCEEPYFKRTPISVAGNKPNCSSGCAGIAGYEEAGDNIKIKNGETLTLTSGNDYVFCSLWTNGGISLTAGTSNESLPIRIFIDNPSSSRCKGFKSYEIENCNKEKEKVEAGSFYACQGVGGLVGGFAQTLAPSQVQIYLAGSGTNDETKFTSTAGAGNAFFLYAPRSLVNVSATTFAGTLLGYDTTVKATLYTQSLGLNNYPLSNSYGVFHIAGYTQCSTSVTSLSSNAASDLSGC
jgi:hypothetical protein